MMNFPTGLRLRTIFRVDQLDDVLSMVRPNFRFAPQHTKVKYFNVPCAFDIESTSFTDADGIKRATMYVWTFGIYGLVIMGRTWDEFVTLCKNLSTVLDLHENKRLIVYVHNLAFDFQFFRKWLEWLEVFAIDVRKPIYAISTIGIEFRCSYLQSGYSLAKIGNDLHIYHVCKLVGDLDYDLIRHSNTPLSEKELDYCANDVRVVMAYIQECIETEGDIGRIPLTKTGYVRRYCRECCLGSKSMSKQERGLMRLRYREQINHLSMSVDEYRQLKRAFQGGFTHANPYYVNKVVHGMRGYDFTSSYPAVLISRRFPMGPAEIVEIRQMSDLYHNLRLYCCVFDIEFIGLESKVTFDNYISRSRCWYQGTDKDIIQDSNGRIVRASIIRTTITGEDFMIIRKMYTWVKIKIRNFRRYKRDYLPTEFIKAILKLYNDKTLLKGVSGREIDYAVSKAMLNSCYGMTVTDPAKDPVTYVDNMWSNEGERKNETVVSEVEKLIAKYNNDKNRFLFYAWGIWVCAYARQNLFTGILEFGNDYIYSDTDSIKVINTDKHQQYIDKYNENIRRMLYKAMDYHKLPYSMVEPIKGKMLGVWDYDGEIESFKTLGAKRYLTRYTNGKIVMTVAGLNKQIALHYLCMGWYSYINTHTQNFDPFDKFSTELYVPPEYTGKKTHTYIDTAMDGVLTDYLGNTSEYHELSGVHLKPADYSLSVTQEYFNYFMSIQDID